MSHFRPVRASPPPKPAAGPSSRVSDYTDETNAIGIIAPELIGLSAEEIDFIDEVVTLAPPSASTFLTVFKAYNDVLQARGLDPRNEVVYYQKLLKIGMIKGKTWRDKWSILKEHQGYVPKASTSSRGGRTTRVTRTAPTPAKLPAKASAHIPYTPRDPGTSTLDSTQDDTGHTEDEPLTKPTRRRIPGGGTTHDDTPRPTRRFDSPATLASTNSLGLDTGPPSTIASSGDALRRIAAHARRAVPRWDAETTIETTTQVSSVPPSYGAAVRDDAPPSKDKGKEKEVAPPSFKRITAYQTSSPMPPVQTLSKPTRERRGSAVETEDPFEKIKRERDEEVADRFRSDRLLERCYEVWKQGYEWIIVRPSGSIHGYSN